MNAQRTLCSIACAVCVGLLASCSDGANRDQAGTAADPTAMVNPGTMSTPFTTPSAVRELTNSPEMTPGAEAELADDAEVIGVLHPSGPRAYVVSAMSGITTHVINEVVDGVPFSVTYCDQTDCARVLTRSDSPELIDLQVAGLRNGEMFLLFDGSMYEQDSEVLPLEDMEFVRTDWKTWFADHPDTVVFVTNETSEETNPPSEEDAPDGENPPEESEEAGDAATVQPL